MVRIADSLDSARRNSDKSSHLAIELNRILNWVAEGNTIDEETQIQLNDIGDEYLLSDLISNIEKWNETDDFQLINEILSLYEDLITHAENNDWQNVAAVYHYHRIQLKSSLSGHDAASEISSALNFLENSGDGISINFDKNTLNIIEQNWNNITESTKKDWLQYLDDAAAAASSANNYNSEREYLRLLHRLNSKEDVDATSVERRLIRSYRSEANVQSNQSQLMKADVLRSGLKECSQYMSDDQKREWKKEALEARRRGTKTELIDIEQSLPLSNDDARDITELVVDEMRENTERIVEFFKSIKDSYDSKYAIYCLLFSDGLIPDTTRMRLSGEEFVFSQIFSKRIYSPEYHVQLSESSESSDIPQNYNIHANSMMSSLGNALYQLIQQGELSIWDFVTILQVSDCLSTDTEFFIVEALFDLFDEEYIQSLYISTPHLEAALVDSFESLGRPAHISTQSGTQQQALGGLISEAGSFFGENYETYLQYRYTSQEGFNLRNRLAHGQLRRVNANYLSAILVMFDITKSIVLINRSKYTALFGLPNRTMSSSTQYRNELDLSLFTDLNRQIVAYGKSPDNHTVVVVRKNRNEDLTKLFIDKGTISEYTLGEYAMDQEDILSKIDELSQDYIKIPENAYYVWLDIYEHIASEVMRIIREETTPEDDAILLQILFERAKVWGIDEGSVRIALDRLEDDEKIEYDKNTITVLNLSYE